MYITLPRCDTKKSAYACAFYTVFIKIASIALALYFVCDTENIEALFKKYDGHTFKINKQFFYYSFIHCSFYLLTGIILYVGVKKEKPCFLILHIIATIIDIGMKFILLIELVNSGATKTIPRMLLAFWLLLPLLVVLVYEIFIVASHYHFLSTRGNMKEQYPLKNTMQNSNV